MKIRRFVNNSVYPKPETAPVDKRMVLDSFAVVCYMVGSMIFSSFRILLLPLLYIMESVIALLLGLYAVSYSAYASYLYPDQPLISWAISIGAILYTCAIGAGSRWGILSPLVVPGLFILIGLTSSFSLTEWILGGAFVCVSAALSLFCYFRHRRQAWLLPASALCALTALIAQTSYTPWEIRCLLDTLVLLLMLAETTCRSIVSLRRGEYFYIVPLWKRLNARKNRGGKA